jgi:predicted nucleic-acid-binding protein
VRVIDTNIVVRILVDDDRAQAEQAKAVLAQGDVLVLKTVILESEWVLRSIYGLDRQRIASILRGLMGLPGLTIEDAAAVTRTLDWFEAGMDFADALHLASTPTGATFLTFDRGLVRFARQLADAPLAADPAG